MDADLDDNSLDMPTAGLDAPDVDVDVDEDEMEFSSTAKTGENDADRSNKLRHNISRKGNNSYYYAHAKTPEALKVVGSVAPAPVAKAPELAKKVPLAVETYSWSDGKKSVSVYIEHADPSSLGDEDLKVSWEPRSFELTIKNPHEALPRVLRVERLYDDIEGAEIKRKTDKVVIVLKKKDNGGTWYRLQASS